MTPHDEWDYDGINEMILADMEVKGKKRKVLVHFDRNGFGYTMDRVSGELLVAEKYDPAVNWATHIDMKTGYPQTYESIQLLTTTVKMLFLKTYVLRLWVPKTNNLRLIAHVLVCSMSQPTTYV